VCRCGGGTVRGSAPRQQSSRRAGQGFKKRTKPAKPSVSVRPQALALYTPPCAGSVQALFARNLKPHGLREPPPAAPARGGAGGRCIRVLASRGSLFAPEKMFGRWGGGREIRQRTPGSGRQRATNNPLVSGSRGWFSADCDNDEGQSAAHSCRIETARTWKRLFIGGGGDGTGGCTVDWAQVGR